METMSVRSTALTASIGKVTLHFLPTAGPSTLQAIESKRPSGRISTSPIVMQSEKNGLHLLNSDHRLIVVNIPAIHLFHEMGHYCSLARTPIIRVLSSTSPGGRVSLIRHGRSRFSSHTQSMEG